MPDVPLAAPESVEELYLARGDDLVAARPVLTGDVFASVALDADDHDGLVMVVAHPCAMRGAKGRLAPRITVAPIRPYQSLPFHRWPSGHYGVLPLPGLRGDADEPRAVHLLELGTVRTSALNREQRILSLTDRGIHILQQRLVFGLTRVAVGLDKLQDQAVNVLLEAELEEEWVDELAANGEPETLESASVEFALYMDGGFRVALGDVTLRSDTVRAVRAEIRRRRAAG